MPMLPQDTQLSIVSMAMDSVLLDLERARMEREDFRSLALRQGGEISDYRQALHDIRDELDDIDGYVPVEHTDNYNRMVFSVNLVLGVDER